MSKTAMSIGIMMVVFMIVLIVVAFIIWKLAITGLRRMRVRSGPQKKKPGK